jgi:hypothetical protein
LRAADIGVGKAEKAAQVPYRMPDIETASESGEARTPLFGPNETQAAGLNVWLALPPGRKLLDLGEDVRERLKALGYLP